MELPPPYSGNGSGQHDVSRQLEILEQIQNLDLQACSHAHELLFSMTEDQHTPPSAVLHHWDFVHGQSEVARTLNLPVRIDGERFELFQGFQDLGTFQIPASEISRDDGLHHFLMSKIIGNRENECVVSSDTEAISSVISYLQGISASEPRADQLSVHLFAIRVLGTDPSTLIVDGAFPAWKWVKENRARRRIEQGFWKPELEDVILHGENRAGKEMCLLVRGVSAVRKDELRNGMVIYPASG
ncbi:hypothetical protein DL95DRAFT_444295 [Leptodontidium sp. 2 PMI_412]|nr:hypothetical protein DL95DRAFT_444295 [Leptodontidium sp. 2 PMI_412]